MEENDDKLFECDKQSRKRFNEFLFKNNYASFVEMLPVNDYLDMRFIDTFKQREHYVEIKQRKLKYLTEKEIYIEDLKFNNLLRIGGSYGYLVTFFGDDLKHMMIHKTTSILDSKKEYFTANKYTVKDSQDELKEIRCIDTKLASYFIYDDNLNNYVKVDYETFIQ